MNDEKYWIWLSMVFGTAGCRLWQMMDIFETAEEAYYEMRSGNRLLCLSTAERRTIENISLESAEETVSECESKGVGMICYSSEKYPKRLKYIINPPPVLYYRGNFGCLNGTKTITAVGTRKADNYSIKATRQICSELARNGIIIVSGFAVGTDITASMAAVSENMPTVCVLGCGVDYNYPKENFEKREEIINAGGVFVSELKPDISVNSGSFSARNRILSALGCATVIFGASGKSGALSTANYSAEQGHEIFVLPPADIFSESYAGNVKLLREGALPLFSADDVLAYLGFETSVNAEIRADIPDNFTAGKSVKNRVSPEKVRTIKKDININNSPYDIPEKSASENKKENISKADKIIRDFMLDGNQKKIIEFLSEGAANTDVIADVLDIEYTQLMTEFAELEMIGILKSLPGNMVEIK